MTTEEIRDAAKVMEAYANGKKIQFLDEYNNWIDVTNPTFNWSIYIYRVKPEPKYRHFKSQEECWNEMLKHQPFGWIKNNDTQCLYNITFIASNNCGIVVDNSLLYFDHALNTCNFADGSPFGIKEE